MRIVRSMTHAAVVLACCGMLMPRGAVLAAGPAAPLAADVALSPAGTLTGIVVTPQGEPIDGAMVAISQGQTLIAQVVTDRQGAFHANGLRGGMYDVKIGPRSVSVRAWTTQMAPPAAQPRLVLVVGGAVRGQDGAFHMDIITLWTLGAATGALVLSAIGLSEIEELEDKVDACCSP